MIVLPAIDLEAGRAVQLVGGEPGTQQVSLAEPLRVLEEWVAQGAQAVHVVDLDAARGTGTNAELVEAMLRRHDVRLQVGGGVRTSERAQTLLAAGAHRVVVGTRALEDPAWLRRLAQRFPDRVIVAVDAKGGRITTRGWTHRLEQAPEVFVRSMDGVPLAGVLATCVDVEGRLGGLDRAFVRRVVEATELPVQISGGVTSLEDVAFLRDAGAAATVVGLALYARRFSFQDAQRVAGGSNP